LKWVSDLTHRATVLGVANVVAGDMNKALASDAPNGNNRLNEPIIVPLHIGAAYAAASDLTSGGPFSAFRRLRPDPAGR
jgi:hypothetical protein